MPILPDHAMPDRPSEPHKKLEGIQLARAIAAILVVLYHAGRMISLPQYVGHIPLGGVFNFGHAGVDFFFVLSGFIIMHVHGGDIGQPDRLLRYVWRRVTRVYPIYWFVTAFVVALAIAKPGGWAALSSSHLMQSILLWPQDVQPLLGVGWTLVHEMLFYTLFAVAIIGRRIGGMLFGLWGVLICMVSFGLVDGPVWGFIGSFTHVQFLMGVGAACIVRGGYVPHPRLLVIMGISGFLTAGLIENAGMISVGGSASQMAFGLCATAMIVGLAIAETQGKIRVGRVGRFLGAASYSLYLIHTIVIGLLARLLATLGVIQRVPDSIVFFLVAGAAIGGGCLLYFFIERPVMEYLNKWGRRIFYRTGRGAVADSGH